MYSRFVAVQHYILYSAPHPPTSSQLPQYLFAYAWHRLPIGDTFGLHSLGTIMGMLVKGWGIGAAFGPAVGGLIFDVFENYFMAFILGALAMMVAASFIALTKKEIAKNG
jgi:MFS family permease